MVSYNKTLIFLSLYQVLIHASAPKSAKGEKPEKPTPSDQESANPEKSPETKEKDAGKPTEDPESTKSSSETDAKKTQEITSQSGIAHIAAVSAEGYHISSVSVDKASMDKFLAKYNGMASTITMGDKVVYLAMSFHLKNSKDIAIEKGQLMLNGDPVVVGSIVGPVNGHYELMSGTHPVVVEALKTGKLVSLNRIMKKSIDLLHNDPKKFEVFTVVPAEGERAADEKNEGGEADASENKDGGAGGDGAEAGDEENPEKSGGPHSGKKDSKTGTSDAGKKDEKISAPDPSKKDGKAHDKPEKTPVS